MKKLKRLFSFLLVCLMLFLYVVPCFADSENTQITVDSSYFNFQNFSGYGIDESSFISEIYTYINKYVNSDGTKIYFFPILLYVDSYSSYFKSYIVVHSQKTLTVEFTENSVQGYPGYFNVNIKSDSEFSTDIITIRGTAKWHQDTRQNAKVIYIPSSKYNMTNSVYDSSNYLLFDNGKCVSEKFCSDSAKGLEDYEEGNVKISGLTGFFNNIINKFNEQIQDIKNIPSNILNGLKELFIPDTTVMKTDFDDFMEYMSVKLGVGPLTDTLKGLTDSIVEDQTSVGAADISENFTYSFSKISFDDNNESYITESIPINLKFSLPFSDYFTDILKERVAGYFKGIFFIMLIFYNLSELYFMIRGVHPWKDPKIVTEMNMMQREDAEHHEAYRTGQRTVVRGFRPD